MRCNWVDSWLDTLANREKVRRLPVWQRVCAAAVLVFVFVVLYAIVWSGPRPIDHGEFIWLLAVILCFALLFFLVIFWSSEQATECMLQYCRSGVRSHTDRADDVV